MTLQYIKERGQYRISGIERERCDNIPGLRWWEDTCTATGSRDALAVLLHRYNHKHGDWAGEIAITPGVLAIPNARPYQNHGVAWLIAHLKADRGALLADDMGLGKSMQTLKTWSNLGKPQLLISCPASVRNSWAKEVRKWYYGEPQVITSGKEAASADPDWPITISSYSLVEKLPPRMEIQFLAIDEAHNIRGRGAKRSRRLLQFGASADYRLGLTGTPMWSRPRDMWMLLHTLFPGYRFGTAEDFDFAYCGAYVNKYGGRVAKGATRSEELRLRLAQVMLRRTKAEVKNEMPSLTHQVRWVEGTPAARRVFEAAALRKISMTEALQSTLETKMDAAVECAKEAGKFFMVTWLKKHAYELHRMCQEEGLSVELITGDTQAKERDAIISKCVQTGSSIIATIDSCGVGVDGFQHVASVGISHHIDYVPLKTMQVVSRLHRLGQKEPVIWNHIAMEDSVEVQVLDTVLSKLNQWEGTMGADDSVDMRRVLNDVAKDESEALAAIYAAMEDG